MKYYYPLHFYLFTFLALFCTAAFSQPVIEWQKTYGGSNNDWDSKIIRTSDHGYLLFGSSNSNDKDVSGNHGFYDFWLVRTDSTGNIAWTKSFGGTKNDFAKCALTTTDGGFIIAGSSESNDGDLTKNQGLTDLWIIKITEAGLLEWQYSYGGSGYDEAIDIKATSDGNFIILGNTTSTDGDIQLNHGSSDIWLVKIDENGSIISQKTYGGSSDDFAATIEETDDSGFIIAGSSLSTDGDIETHYGITSNADYFIIKTDDLGAKQWVKNYGGNNSDMLGQLIKTPDGGYLLCGFSNSDNGDVTGNHGNYDAWLIKISQTGGVQWQKSVGGSDEDIAKSISIRSDGDYMLCGTTSSNDGQVAGNRGNKDFWIVRLNNSGPVLWQKCLGGTNVEEACMALLPDDESFIISGFSNSVDGDITINNGDFDYWLLKLSNLSVLPEFSFNTTDLFSIYPNPSTSGKIQISFNGTISENIHADIISIEGSVIFSTDFPSSSVGTVDISKLPKSMYFLRLTGNNITGIQKFVVQ
jgi:hypothetical protein